MSEPTIAVVISCYKNHLQKLLRLLESIGRQTVLPTQVIVSSSSCEPSDVPAIPQYPFPVTLILHKERKNAAQNRNIAMKLATSDIVSFIDADDIMMPRRLEAIRTAFVQGAQFVVHNYTENLKETDDGGNAFYIEHNVLRNAGLGLIHMRDRRIPLHHSQSSVARNIIEAVQYREDACYERREDSVFCSDVITRGCTTAYIANPLSIYDMSGVW
jgi:glycosyltransferase involved in cell wall biosynthesis